MHQVSPGKEDLQEDEDDLHDGKEDLHEDDLHEDDLHEDDLHEDGHLGDDHRADDNDNRWVVGLMRMKTMMTTMITFVEDDGNNNMLAF